MAKEKDTWKILKYLENKTFLNNPWVKKEITR